MPFQVVAHRVHELVCLVDQPAQVFISDRRLNPIVGHDAPVEGIQKLPMELGVKNSRLSEVLPKRRVHAPVPPKPQPLLNEKRFCRIEHRVVGTIGGKVQVIASAKGLGRADGAAGLIQQLAGLVFHAGIASSRTLARNEDPWMVQSLSGTKVRLIATPYFRDNSEFSTLVRSTSSP